MATGTGTRLGTGMVTVRRLRAENVLDLKVIKSVWPFCENSMAVSMEDSCTSRMDIIFQPKVLFVLIFID